MDAERIEQAVQRIEAALARIGAVADAPALAPVTDTVPGETEAHLRQTVADTLAELDLLIGKLDT